MAEARKTQPGRHADAENPGLKPEGEFISFDPFCSTTFTGRGLGLAAVLGIVKDHKGMIRGGATSPWFFST